MTAVGRELGSRCQEKLSHLAAICHVRVIVQYHSEGIAVRFLACGGVPHLRIEGPFQPASGALLRRQARPRTGMAS